MNSFDNPNENAGHADLTDLTAHVVGAYVTKNPISPGDLPKIIAEVHAALSRLGQAPAESKPGPRSPAVPVRRSVQPDAITCLECGKKFKSMRRHLMTHHQLTPEQYRERWNLPRNYPMVAPVYSETRSSLARAAGLGRKPAAKKARRPKTKG